MCVFVMWQAEAVAMWLGRGRCAAYMLVPVPKVSEQVQLPCRLVVLIYTDKNQCQTHMTWILSMSYKWHCMRGHGHGHRSPAVCVDTGQVPMPCTAQLCCCG